ncbi:MAG: GatB/YqeY domain-containing protein [Candidatus Moraniibacteriota bacterium]
MTKLTSAVHEDMKEAMRSGDSFRRDTLRFLESALKNAALEKRMPLSELSDDDVFVVLRRSVKQREDSARQYRAGNRDELAEKEEQEKSILAAYLPVAPDESVIREAVERAIAETGATSRKDMGKVMGLVMKSLVNASGNDVRRITENLLGS